MEKHADTKKAISCIIANLFQSLELPCTECKEYLKYCLVRHGIDFLGFHTYLTESGKVIRKLRRGSKNKMRKKIRKYASMLEQKRITLKEVEQSYKSWKAHASHGDCYYLVKKMDQYYNKYIKKEKSNGTKNK